MSIVYYLATVLLILVLFVFFYRFIPKPEMPYRIHRRRVLAIDHKIMVISGEKVKAGSLVLYDNVPIAEVLSSRNAKENVSYLILSNVIRDNPKQVDILVF
jgi:hypothetical protein